MASVTAPGLHYCNPIVPNALLLPGGIRHGTEISIQGKVPAGVSRFTFNLQKGASEEAAPVVFHFNPRFEEGTVVVRNACSEGSVWGEEERSQEQFPFAHKENFRVVIQATEECYKVVVNGHHYADFRHRFPLEDATHLYIKGQVRIYSIHLPIPKPDNLVASIPGYLKLGDIIFVNARVEGQKFTVNLQRCPEESSDIGLHMNGRLNLSTVVRNSLLDGNWGPEETDGGVPFSQGATFNLALSTLRDHFKIYVNGVHFANYAHRCPVEHLCTLVVNGEIKLNNVVIESVPERTVMPRGINDVKLDNISIQEFTPNLPFSFGIPGGMSPGRIVYVSGAPLTDATQFAVNLKRSDGDILLHFNPRFEKSIVIRNSLSGSSWGAEEVDGPGFPFEGGINFNLVLINAGDHIDAWVNENPFCAFVNRGDVTTADQLEIVGDVFAKRIFVA